MSYKTRSARRVSKKSKRKFFGTIFIIFFLLYATMNWILPNIIGGVGFINNIFKSPSKVEKPTFQQEALAPPVISIPYEATNSAKIDIKGYASPNTKVRLFLDDNPEDTVDVNVDGSFTAQNISLSLGNNSIYGKVIDQNNHESLASKTIVLVLDTQKPILRLSEPDNGKEVTGDEHSSSSSKKVTVAGQSDVDAQVLVNNIRVILDSDGKFKTDVPLNDGDNTITVRAVDKASNFEEIVRKITYKSP